MASASAALADSIVGRAASLMLDMSPLMAIPLGIGVAALVGAVVIGWVRS